MSVDPSAALAVNIASAPGTFAFFLGAGISVPSGIPTGGQILEEVCEKYYRGVEKEEPAEDLDVVEWAEDNLDLDEFTFSSIHEAVFDSNDAREDYLREKFQGMEPTDAHMTLAELASEGWIKTFVTTNFDRLLENALEELGVSFTTVARSDDLGEARPREHSPVYILKIHGDYRRGGLRITEDDTSELPQEIELEFEEILDNYGLVTVGYSGNDGSFQEIVRQKRPRNGLYWTCRNEVEDPDVQDLLDLVDARTIKCENANSFCRDLKLRINSIKNQPRGKSPEEQRNEVIHMIRHEDSAVGVKQRADNLWDSIRKKTREFIEEHGKYRWYEGRLPSPPSGNDFDQFSKVIDPILDTFYPIIDNFLSAAIAAFEYDSEGKWEFIRPLPKYFRFEHPSQQLDQNNRQASKLPAYLMGNSLVLAGLLTETPSLFETARLKDPKTGKHWLFQTDPHYHDLLRDHPVITFKFWMDFLRDSEAISMSRNFDQKLKIYAAFSNVLMGIGEKWYGYGESYWHGIAYGRRHEDLIKRLSYDDAFAKIFAVLYQSDYQEVRRKFEEYYRKLWQAKESHYVRRRGTLPRTLDLLQTS